MKTNVCQQPGEWIHKSHIQFCGAEHKYLEQNWTLSAFNQSRYNKALAVKPSTGIYFSPALSGKLIKKNKRIFLTFSEQSFLRGPNWSRRAVRVDFCSSWSSTARRGTRALWYSLYNVLEWITTSSSAASVQSDSSCWWMFKDISDICFQSSIILWWKVPCL